MNLQQWYSAEKTCQRAFYVEPYMLFKKPPVKSEMIWKLTCYLQFDADRHCGGTPELSHTTGGLYRDDSYLQEQFASQLLSIGLYILWQNQKAI